MEDVQSPLFGRCATIYLSRHDSCIRPNVSTPRFPPPPVPPSCRLARCMSAVSLADGIEQALECVKQGEEEEDDPVAPLRLFGSFVEEAPIAQLRTVGSMASFGSFSSLPRCPSFNMGDSV